MRNHAHQCRRLYRDCNGAIAVEFAFAFPLFILFVIGVMTVGHMFWIQNSLQYAVDHAGRFAMMNASATTEQIREETKSHMHGVPLSTTNITISVTTQGSGSAQMRTVTAVYQYDALTGLITTPISLRGTVTVPVL